MFHLAVATALVALGTVGPARAAGGVYAETRHGDPDSGVQRLPSEPVGDCAQCHDMHASRDGTPTGGPHPYVLFAPNDNGLCGEAGCHVGAGVLDIYPGPTAYDASAHAMSPQTVWPGPDPRARPAGSAGDCVNCHTPHGRADGAGLVPSLLSVREEGGCLGCHDVSGPASTDLAGELTKASVHPITTYSGRHLAAESNPIEFASARRHVECEDCHNPHDASPDPFTPDPPAASARLGRISRVSVTNGAVGSQPAYTFRPASDPSPVLEYEVCFKCHSSWTSLPPGRTDLAIELNPANPSYHPVEAAGADPGIDPASFTSGWGPFDLLHCGDCHGNGGAGPAGPHGSVNAGLLVAPFPASPAFRQMGLGELCFRCHDPQTYADEGGNEEEAASRWNDPAADGHNKHFKKDVTCYSCHAVHGSTTLPHLLVLGRNPGLVDWAEFGGTRTCSSTCHQTESYDVNY